MTALYDIPLKTLDGRPSSLGEYKGKVLLIVNVASKCGLTPQYTALEALHEKLAPKGFSVLGFPCNDFGAQEPGTSDEIKTFCSTTYGVTFPLFEKVSVKGEACHPLYRQLMKDIPHATPKPGGGLKDRLAQHGLAPKSDTDIMWNFEKFVISRDGRAVARFAPDVTPDDAPLMDKINSELAK